MKRRSLKQISILLMSHFMNIMDLFFQKQRLLKAAKKR